MESNVHYLIFFSAVLNCSLALGQTDADEPVSPNCTEARDAFAYATTNFIKCSIEYSRPIKFCEKCVEQYMNVQNNYHNMSQVLNNGTTCINYFINLDRLGIVNILYQNSIDLWTRAKCYECFILENGNLTGNLSHETILFNDLFEDFTKCVNQTDTDLVCTGCMEQYLALQENFFKISNNNEKIGACMDLVDSMNTTWTYWGNKCCEIRKHNEYIFKVSISLLLGVTVLFYIVVQIYAKNKLPTIIEQTRFVNTLET